MDFSGLVDVRHIDFGDRTFEISTHSRIDAVCQSIKRIGIINPPILWSRAQSLVIVAGFARAQACRTMGWDQIPARCLPPEASYSEAVLLAIGDNCSQRELNVVEQAKSVHLLNQAFTSPSDRVRAAQSLGLKINQALEAKLLAVHTMGQQLQLGLLEGTIGLPIAVRIFAVFGEYEAEALAELIRSLHISLTRQRELVDWIEIILRRDGITLPKLLSDPNIIHWRNDDQLDAPHRSRLIRDQIKKRCYPSISAFEQRYANAVKALGLDKSISLIPPPNFEGRSFSLRIEFTGRDEFIQKAEEIRRLTQSADFCQLLDPEY